MALYKIGDRYPDYKDRYFDGNDLKGTDVYLGNTRDKVGSIHDVLISEAGRIRYLVMAMGSWLGGQKKVLLPIGRCVDAPNESRIYLRDMTHEQVKQLPRYDSDMTIDHDYEEQVRNIYRESSAETSVPVEMSVPVEGAGVIGLTTPVPVPTPAPAPTPEPVEPEPVYDREPDLYEMRDRDHDRIRLYEERLVADKHREKVGNIRIKKHIVTNEADVSVPIQKEKVVIEVETNLPGGTRINAPDARIGEDDTREIDVYAERPDVRKETVAYQEVNVRKEVEQDVVTAHDTVRREELDVDAEGNPVIEDRSEYNPDRRPDRPLE